MQNTRTVSYYFPGVMNGRAFCGTTKVFLPLTVGSVVNVPSFCQLPGGSSRDL